MALLLSTQVNRECFVASAFDIFSSAVKAQEYSDEIQKWNENNEAASLFLRTPIQRL